MLAQTTSRQFERDYVKQFKRHKDLSKLKAVMRLIVEEKPLGRKHRDHPLTGNWTAYRDCHIEPDWLLIYKIDQNGVLFERTGSHADLFG
jgi:mRNA interferase YafQ